MCGYAFSSAGSSFAPAPVASPASPALVDSGDPSGCFASLDDEKTLTFSACFNHTLLATSAVVHSFLGPKGQENHV